MPVPVHGTAAGFATKAVPLADPGETVGSVRERVSGARFESALDVAVCDGERLVGLIRIEDLLAAPAEAGVADLMDRRPPVVGPEEDREVAARLAGEHGESSLAVIDASERFLGLIPPSRLLAVLLEEHAEDMSRLGGYLHTTEAARRAAEEPLLRRYLHRLPWLLVGLAGALLAALIVGAFERRLEADVIVAFFVPGIVYLADAVGTQTEALVIRGLSVGADIRSTVRRELLTGLLVGASLAVAFVPIGLLVWGRVDVVVAVAVSLMAACSVATLVAMSLPALIDRFGGDPAFGSGPLATVVQDLLSLVIYFAVAARLVG